MLQHRKLALILDFVDVERLIGIPCYLDQKLYGYLKHGNRTHLVPVLLPEERDRNCS